MTYYYVHAESGSAFLSEESPEVVMASGDGQMCDITDRFGYEKACVKFNLTPEPHPDPCLETRRRIRVAVAAWAYEMHNDSIMSDAEFDALALEIDTNRSTANSEMDEWFALEFSPHTGVWVRSHPNKIGLELVYRMLRKDRIEDEVYQILRSVVHIHTTNQLHIWMVAA